MESFRHGDIDDKKHQKHLIANFLRAVYLYDDHIKITFDFDDDETGLDVPFETAESETSDAGSSCVLISTPQVYHC